MTTEQISRAEQELKNQIDKVFDFQYYIKVVKINNFDDTIIFKVECGGGISFKLKCYIELGRNLITDFKSGADFSPILLLEQYTIKEFKHQLRNFIEGMESTKGVNEELIIKRLKEISKESNKLMWD